MDPVCMLTIYPQLLRNFVYKMPDFMRMTSLLGFVDSLRFVFSRDLMVAEVCGETISQILTPTLGSSRMPLVFLAGSVLLGGGWQKLLIPLTETSVSCFARRPAASR